jgi:hypothetical protein
MKLIQLGQKSMNPSVFLPKFLKKKLFWVFDVCDLVAP